MPELATSPTSDRIRFLMSLLKLLIILLVPLCLGRLCTGDIWGGLNAAAGPITGIFLLKDEGPAFGYLYAQLSSVWLVQECCGLERGVPFEYALFIFTIIVGLCSCGDAYAWCYSASSTTHLQRVASHFLISSAACEGAAAYVGVQLVVEFQKARSVAERPDEYRGMDMDRVQSRLSRPVRAHQSHRDGRSTRRTRSMPMADSFVAHPETGDVLRRTSTISTDGDGKNGWLTGLFRHTNRQNSVLESAEEGTSSRRPGRNVRFGSASSSGEPSALSATATIPIMEEPGGEPRSAGGPGQREHRGIRKMTSDMIGRSRTILG